MKYIECGYLTNKKTTNSDRSLFASIGDISNVIPKNKGNSKFLCMINFGEYSINDIPYKDGKSVDGIRVIFHKKDCEEALDFCHKLSKKGYMLFIQPMVTIDYSDSELYKMIQYINKINPFAFYIVDSFGVMKQKDLLRIFLLIDKALNININIGYHSHNNLQLAFSNAQVLLSVVTDRNVIIDSTVFGMGRGAGNLNTELITELMNSEYATNYKVESLLDIIDNVLNKIYSRNKWGYSLPHFISATQNCHPSYATFLSSKNTLSISSIRNIISKITIDKRSHFDEKYIDFLYTEYQKHYMNDTEVIKRFKKILFDKTVMLLAPGRSIVEPENLERIIGLKKW